MWPFISEEIFLKKSSLELKKNKLIVNLGHVGGTANTLGLKILVDNFLPIFKNKFHEPFEMHILGRGDLSKELQKKISYFSEIKVRGFVEDIDREIQESKAVITLNNASTFKVGHSRFLHIMALGTVNIGHIDVCLSMPELKSSYNVLLGSSIEDIADKTILALTNKKIRQNIASNALITLKDKYECSIVAEEIKEDIEQLYNKGKSKDD